MRELRCGVFGGYGEMFGFVFVGIVFVGFAPGLGSVADLEWTRLMELGGLFGGW